jgi:undecaprenyl diphosphate synthase
VVRAAPGLGIEVLTLYAFSSDNWQRPRAEVEMLMQLFRRFLRSETAACLEHGIRLNVIGRRDRLNIGLHSAIARAEQVTAAGDQLLLRIAVDYSARDAILQAAAAGPSDSRDEFARRVAAVSHSVSDLPDVDLMIRTGEERRLSDFLLWESAYAELYFSNTLWPDFDESGLRESLDDYHRRDRRFGQVPVSAAG